MRVEEEKLEMLGSALSYALLPSPPFQKDPGGHGYGEGQSGFLFLGSGLLSPSSRGVRIAFPLVERL